MTALRFQTGGRGHRCVCVCVGVHTCVCVCVCLCMHLYVCVCNEMSVILRFCKCSGLLPDEAP